MTTGYGMDDRGSISDMDKRFSLLRRFQTGSGAHPTSYPMGRGGLFPPEQSDRGVELTTQPNPVSRPRMVELYLHSSIRLHGVVLN
jgi:hypothetical protein